MSRKRRARFPDTLFQKAEQHAREWRAKHLDLFRLDEVPPTIRVEGGYVLAHAYPDAKSVPPSSKES